MIDIPGIGKTAAKTICDEMKIKTQGDKKLEEAKKTLYLKGFYDGVMVIGPHTGKKVCYCAGFVMTTPTTPVTVLALACINQVSQGRSPSIMASSCIHVVLL